MERIQTDAGIFKQPTAEKEVIAPPKKQIKPVVVGKSFGEFSERDHLRQSQFEYLRTRKDPGKVLIFNQENYQGDYRSGTRRDVNELIICFQRLGYNIDADHIYTDYQNNEILDELDKVCQMDGLSEINSFIVIFLSHGDNNNQLNTDHGNLDITNIWQKLGHCEVLTGIPKLFIFQACKGKNKSSSKNNPITEMEKKQIELATSSIFSPKNLIPDMLVCFSTTEGNVSFRHPNTGSWFIQELCKNFTAYAWNEDIISLLTRTSKCVARNYFDDGIYEMKKQMPLIVSTLRKKFYLNKNKHRDILLQQLEVMDEMHKVVVDIQSKVDKIYEAQAQHKK